MKNHMYPIKERLTKMVHLQWSIWQENQDKRAIHEKDVVSFTQGTWQEWNRKSNTPFQLLTSEEQQSDREIAEKLYISALIDWLNFKRAQNQKRTLPWITKNPIDQEYVELIAELQIGVTENAR